MPPTSASKSCRITRSAIIRGKEIFKNEIKEENVIPKVELNEWIPPQQPDMCESVAVSADANDDGCLFDLSKVKVEIIEETNEPLEEILDNITTVDLSIVKNEHENGLRLPNVLLTDCLNHKIKLEQNPLEPGLSTPALEDNSNPITTFVINTVKKEKESLALHPYVLLEDCSLNRKIKLEPSFPEEKPDSVTGPALQAVKNEGIVDCNVKTEPTRRSKRNHVKIEYEEQEDDTTRKRLSRSATTPLVKYEAFDGRKTKFEPPNWVEVMDHIRKMRKERNAPIDIMGSHQWMKQGENPKVSRYQTFISLLLSSKTRDEVNHAAMTRLRKHGLTVSQILETDEETIGELIAPVSFWRTKARQVLRSTALLRERHKDDVPKTVVALVSLPGVGPKMAHICLSVTWGKTTGIGVGSFVHRVANRLGWAQAWEPERTRLALESWLPRSYWPEINELLVGFGQQTCRARDPRCDQCLIAAKVMCPSAPFSLYYDFE